MEANISSDQKERQSEGLHPEIEPSDLDHEVVVVDDDGTAVNASGWKDQLDRQYGLLSLCGIALTVDNAWVALGSSISVSIGKNVVFFSLSRKILIHVLDSKWRTSWPYFQPYRRRCILLVHWS